jgi:hypothetical protein
MIRDLSHELTGDQGAGSKKEYMHRFYLEYRETVSRIAHTKVRAIPQLSRYLINGAETVCTIHSLFFPLLVAPGVSP